MFRKLAGIALGTIALGVFVSWWIGTAQSQTAPNKCASSKLKAAGKKASQKTNCWSKAVGKGEAVDGACLQKATESFTAGFDKAEAAGACTTTGDESSIESLVDSLIADLVTSLRGADNTTPSKCTANEFKAAGKKASKLAGCHAKAASKGLVVDPNCLTKVRDSFTTSFGKAVAVGGCLTAATATDTEARIDTFIDALVLALNPPPTTTTGTLPTGALGPRELTLGSNSHVISNALSSGGGNVDSGTAAGSLSLLAGLPDPGTGIASLTIASDSKFGFGLVNGSKLCALIQAAGSTGKIDCDGGTPMDVLKSIDSNGAAAGETPVLAVEQGAAGRPGSGYVQFRWTVVSCPDSGGACGSLASSADCLNPAKVDFSKGELSTTDYAFTTEKGTGTLTEAKQGGNSTLSKTGVPFDCTNWTSSGPGTVELPAPNEDTDVLGTIKDTVNVFQLAE